MFGSVILDVAIGMCLIYFLFALIMTSVTEAISQAVNMRAAKLDEGLRNLFYLDDPNKSQEFLDKFYKHPLIYALYRGNGEDGKKPGYIPAEIFATVVLDILHQSKEGVKTIDTLRSNLEKVSSDTGDPAQQIAKAILTLMDNSENDLTKLKENIGKWFDASMDRVTGWYKQWTHQIILGVSIVVIAACNVDTINLTTALMNDKALREGMVAVAEQTVKNASATAEVASTAVQIQEQIRDMPLPIGWGEYQKEIKQHNADSSIANYIILKIVGLAITVFAVSLGAPFWFDIMSKLVNIRNNGIRPGSSSGGGKDAPSPPQPVNISVNTAGNSSTPTNPYTMKEYQND